MWRPVVSLYNQRDARESALSEPAQICEQCGLRLTGEERRLGARRCPACTEVRVALSAEAADPKLHEGEPAGSGSRVLAYFIDYFLAAAAGFAFLIGGGLLAGLAATAAGADPGEADVAAVTGAIASLYLVILAYFWIGNSLGQTPGKRLQKLAVVSVADRKPIGLRRGLIRALVWWLGAIPLYLGWLWSFWDKDRQAWHDKAAGTIVVQTPSRLSVKREHSLLRIVPIAGVAIAIVAAAAGVIVGLADFNQDDEVFDSLFAEQENRQGSIDLLYDFCSPEWISANAENNIGTVAKLLDLVDTQGAIEQSSRSLEDACFSGDFTLACSGYASAIATRAGVAPGLLQELLDDCLAELRAEVVVLRLSAGDCVIYDDVAGYVEEIVDCATPQSLAVIATFEATATSYPGEDAIYEIAVNDCPLSTDIYYYPLEAGWNLGDRQIACIED